MVTVGEACQTIQKIFPRFRIIGCNEITNYYVFSIPPRRWDGNGTPPSGGEVECIDKNTGEHITFTNDEYVDIILEEPGKPRKVDILQYLSKDDAEFAEKVSRAS